MANRLPQGRRQAPKNDAPPPREAVIGDNAHGEEAERVQLLSYISKLSGQEDEIQRLKVPFDAAKKAKTTTFRLAKAAGFLRKDLERRLEEMNQPSREIAEEAAREKKHRRWLGILDDEQAELMLSMTAPQEVKDEAHWKAMGYMAGLRLMSSTAPPECGERFVQAFMHEHERGFKESTLANAPKPIKPAPLTPAEQARADFLEDQAEAEATDKAAKRLAKDPAFMRRDGPDAEFEAAAEELASQVDRQAVVGGRETEDVV